MTFLKDPEENQRVLTMSPLVMDNEHSSTTTKLKNKASVDKSSSTLSKRQASQAHT